MASLNIFCSDLLNFLKEVAKKIGGKVHKDIFCGPSKTHKNISSTLQKPTDHPSSILNVQSLSRLIKPFSYTTYTSGEKVKLLRTKRALFPLITGIKKQVSVL